MVFEINWENSTPIENDSITKDQEDGFFLSDPNDEDC